MEVSTPSYQSVLQWPTTGNHNLEEAAGTSYDRVDSIKTAKAML
jgi:hypothetical protein